MENAFGKPVEVEVRDSLEKAMKILKQKMSKEGILQELKRRRFYEKPSVKRKRKTREARKRLRREMKRRVIGGGGGMGERTGGGPGGGAGPRG
jgi:small subunit ribosomal protein S21